MIMATVALLERKPKPTDDEISDGMNGNLCRCCGYANIRDAVKRAAAWREVTHDDARPTHDDEHLQRADDDQIIEPVGYDFGFSRRSFMQVLGAGC